MKPSKHVKQYGLLAEYESASAVFHACEQVRDAGYIFWDSHTPYPVHNLDKAMGLKRSILPWIVFGMGMLGASSGMLLQWWASVIAYPLIISAKPLFSYQAFIPVTFELGVLFAAFGAVFGMFGINKLPQLYHALFKNPMFDRASDDRFFISIEVRDPNYDLVRTRRLLEKTGAIRVEEVEE